MEQVKRFLAVCTRHFKNGFQLNFTSLNKLVFVYLTFRIFVDGVEEFLIQPTAWYYMDYFGESHVFLGLVLAAYSIGTLIFAPFIGLFEVKFQASKSIVLMCGLVKFFGNLLYAIPVNGYFPLFGRFISGVGEGTIGVLYGAVTKCTTNKNRAQAFLYFEGLFNVGAIFGPTIGSALTFHLNIFGWEINAGNSPGVVLAVVWFLLLILTIFLPRDLTENSKAEQKEPAFSPKDSDEETTLTQELSEDSRCGCAPSTVFCVYYLIFLSVFVYNVVQFYFPLLTVHHLGLSLNHVELIYLNSSLFVVVLYIATYLFIDKISEKKFLFCAILFTIVPISITFYFALMWNNLRSVNGVYLLMVSMIIASSGFASFALACSLLSKITPTNSAAFYQSLTFTTAHIAIIIGRLTAGATFSKTPMIFNCAGLVIAWAFGSVWLIIEYKHLPPKP